ncbi:MAG: transaldolase [Planctomycetes bacterium]|nr:transaldolase [Planctomycetota bacterium]
MTNRIKQLAALGQAAWLDFISRDLLRSGRLRELVEAGVTGVTSNPTILQKAVAAGNDYDAQIAELAQASQSTKAIYEALALTDIAEAADQLRSVYNETHARDGFVSIEVSPNLAHDTDGTVAEARRLFHAIGRPNVMIKVPATDAGLPAVTTLIGEGINVNVTLIFALPMYARVMQAYLDGVRRFAASGHPAGLVSSVASFFVSRIDTLVDQQLNERIANGAEHLEALLGRAAIASAKVAYSMYKPVFAGEAFNELRASGARVQRPLWASTSTKNPAYPDTMYVTPLIGPNTINTLPPQTLEAIQDHGVIAQSIEQELDQARAELARIQEAGIDLAAVTDQLLADGVRLFAESFEQLLANIETKRAELKQAG